MAVAVRELGLEPVGEVLFIVGPGQAVAGGRVVELLLIILLDLVLIGELQDGVGADLNAIAILKVVVGQPHPIDEDAVGALIVDDAEAASVALDVGVLSTDTVIFNLNIDVSRASDHGERFVERVHLPDAAALDDDQVCFAPGVLFDLQHRDVVKLEDLCLLAFVHLSKHLLRGPRARCLPPTVSFSREQSAHVRFDFFHSGSRGAPQPLPSC